MLIDKFVEEMDDDTRLSILEDYESFREKGMIGDCALRESARALMKLFNTGDNITLWMEHIAMACYRFYGKKYIKEHFNRPHSDNGSTPVS